MRKLLHLSAVLFALPLLQSCVPPNGYYSATAYNSGGSYRQTHTTFVHTSNARWTYDPYRRCYYDTRVKRYYDTSRGRYHTSAPQRHSSPSYPSGYSKGQPMQLHSRLPQTSRHTPVSIQHRPAQNTQRSHPNARTNSWNLPKPHSKTPPQRHTASQRSSAPQASSPNHSASRKQQKAPIQQQLRKTSHQKKVPLQMSKQPQSQQRSSAPQKQRQQTPKSSSRSPKPQSPEKSHLRERSALFTTK